MFNFLKKMRNKDNTPKKGYDLSYDNLAIPEIHIKGNADAKPGGSDNKVKLGHIETQKLIQAMPEWTAAQKTFEEEQIGRASCRERV